MQYTVPSFRDSSQTERVEEAVDGVLDVASSERGYSAVTLATSGAVLVACAAREQPGIVELINMILAANEAGYELVPASLRH
jgi:hypothetical protein